ncbi:chemotaxis protein CheW [Bremerella cremea]|uniref:chemotaxis protein CheW n=1 Tax=Bremerella cremea TaxID=1031537 RepID=UPI0021BCEF3F|nr:chemotaxis protein CheW [Bremerella cremea]
MSIVESLRPSSKQIVHMPNRRDVINVRGETVPLVFVHQLLGAPARSFDPCDGLVIVVEYNGRKFGLVVDELIGQLQVVMKSLEANYGRVNGIAGATILGDGRVAMIIDLAGIVRLASSLYMFFSSFWRLSSE